MEKKLRNFLDGNCYNAYDFMGSRIIFDSKNNPQKTTFRIYAPNCKEIYVVLYWPEEMRLKMSHEYYGFYYLEVDKSLLGYLYKYEIIDKNNNSVLKSDPFAHKYEVRPSNCSIVSETYYAFGYDKYFETKSKTYDTPMLVYEANLGSWKTKSDGSYYTYREIADHLVFYLKANNYTHLELMPIYEYPLDASWGYQGTGFYAPTSRFGSFQDLCYLVDTLHRNNIGIILDFVLGHINKDSFGLYKFDSSYLYEFEDEFRRENTVWGTANLDFGKGQTRSFMQSAINFWIELAHIDGFRIDAVSNMFYILGNKDNGILDSGVLFLSNLNKFIDSKKNKAITFAEDSSTFGGVTDKNKIGFDYKWNMGFMNDTIKYYNYSDIDRVANPDLITFSAYYMHSEKFILAFSHDEVVHGKGSMINKMFGTYENKFLNYRNFLVYFFTFPGKKLLFQGQEFAQFSEWDFNKEIDWNLYEYPVHRNLNNFYKSLTKVYTDNKELHQLDYDTFSFRWIRMDIEKAIFSYARFSKDGLIIVVLNMLDREYQNYKIGVPKKGNYIKLIDSYGLTNENKKYITFSEKSDSFDNSIDLKLRPYQAIILKFSKD